MRGDDPRRKRSQKCACASTKEYQKQKAAWTGIPGDARCLEQICMPRRQTGKDDEFNVDRHVRAQDVKIFVALPPVWENPDAMNYANLASKYIGFKRLETLSRHEQMPRTTYEEESHNKVYKV